MNAYTKKSKTVVTLSRIVGGEFKVEYVVECDSYEEARAAQEYLTGDVPAPPINVPAQTPAPAPAPAPTRPMVQPQQQLGTPAPAPTTPNFFGSNGPQQPAPAPAPAPQNQPAVPPVIQPQQGPSGLELELATMIANEFCNTAGSSDPGWKDSVTHFLTTSIAQNPGAFMDLANSAPGRIVSNDQAVVNFVHQNAQQMLAMRQNP